MHKLKQTFGKKDDDTHTNAATGDNVEPEPRSTGILRQVLNPGHDKYEEEIHGTTDTATPGVPNPAELKPNPNVKLQTDPAKEGKEHGVLKQILNPGGDKYDVERHGITTLPPTEGSESGNVRPAAAEAYGDTAAQSVEKRDFE